MDPVLDEIKEKLGGAIIVLWLYGKGKVLLCDLLTKVFIGEMI